MSVVKNFGNTLRRLLALFTLALARIFTAIAEALIALARAIAPDEDVADADGATFYDTIPAEALPEIPTAEDVLFGGVKRGTFPLDAYLDDRMPEWEEPYGQAGAYDEPDARRPVAAWRTPVDGIHTCALGEKGCPETQRHHHDGAWTIMGPKPTFGTPKPADRVLATPESILDVGNPTVMSVYVRPPEPADLPCSTCAGTGLVDWAPGQHRDSEDEQQPCPDCPAGEREAHWIGRRA